jgi:hypothetical protein
LGSSSPQQGHSIFIAAPIPLLLMIAVQRRPVNASRLTAPIAAGAWVSMVGSARASFVAAVLADNHALTRWRRYIDRRRNPISV